MFRNMSVMGQYAAERKQPLCYDCLGKRYATKDRKSRRWLSTDVRRRKTNCCSQQAKMGKGYHLVNVCAAKIKQSNEVQIFFQIVPVSIQSGHKKKKTVIRRPQKQVSMKTYECQAQRSWHTRTEDLKTEEVPIKKRLHTKLRLIVAFANQPILLRNKI